MRRSNTTRPTSNKNPRSIGGEAANIWHGFLFEFGREVLDFLMTFPEGFAVLSQIPTREKNLAAHQYAHEHRAAESRQGS